MSPSDDNGEDKEEESLRQYIFGTPTVDQISLFLRSIANSIDTFQRNEQQHEFGCGVKMWGIENQVDNSTSQICPFFSKLDGVYQRMMYGADDASDDDSDDDSVDDSENGWNISVDE